MATHFFPPPFFSLFSLSLSLSLSFSLLWLYVRVKYTQGGGKGNRRNKRNAWFLSLNKLFESEDNVPTRLITTSTRCALINLTIYSIVASIRHDRVIEFRKKKKEKKKNEERRVYRVQSKRILSFHRDCRYLSNLRETNCFSATRKHVCVLEKKAWKMPYRSKDHCFPSRNSEKQRNVWIQQ